MEPQTKRLAFKWAHRTEMKSRATKSKGGPRGRLPLVVALLVFSLDLWGVFAPAAQCSVWAAQSPAEEAGDSSARWGASSERWTLARETEEQQKRASSNLRPTFELEKWPAAKGESSGIQAEDWAHLGLQLDVWAHLRLGGHPFG